ncbi:CAP domain-containing protein [Paenibacillus tarimensis]|uniref:CAP domain-containing protein n=1 Tax=Paenibacillus tarimensis TaxID=416012 RepID=UPI001EEEF440|nr:CAP domain-containing protein [Paenibacillus tarimensis]MCF2942282.1 CAP domain-containing protein [Paenibacillus tarimensis]
MIRNQPHSLITRIAFLTAMITLLAGSVIPGPHPSGAHAAAASSFKDTQGHWAASTIEWASRSQIAAGYGDGTFRPDRTVQERDFIVMLMRAYPELKLRQAGPQDKWYEPSYEKAEELNWPTGIAPFRRGEAAVLLAAANGRSLTVNSAVQWLLDEGLSNGKTAPTVAGFKAADTMTRAEALTFIYNQKQYKPELSSSPVLPAAKQPDKQAVLSLRSIAVGDTAASVTSRLGEPSRKDTADNGMQWYVYNSNYADFAMIGIKSGKVVALFSNAKSWNGSNLIQVGMDAEQALEVFRSKHSATSILRGEDYYSFTAGPNSYQLYRDKLDGNKLAAILVLEEGTQLAGTNQTVSAERASAMERQVFDLANAERFRRGLQPFVWDDQAAASSRKHSKDMAVNSYFSHTNLRDESPFDRMSQEGITYRMAAENIAAGHANAFHVHIGWMNSEGHRTNLMNERLTKLGVGIYAGGSYKLYYTQNFYTP